MEFLHFVLVLLVLVYFLYRWVNAKSNTFTERGVPFDAPALLFGNIAPIMRKTASFMTIFQDFYKRHKADKVAGFFIFRDPAYVVMAPELIKKITVKDFDHFPNHYTAIRTNRDPLLTSMLTVLKDQRWKDMRGTLSPAFTAAKMRNMFTLMHECFEQCLHNLKSNSKNGSGFEIELKECFNRLSNDIIASTAFGLKVNSYEDPNNEFYTIGQTINQLRGRQMFRFVFASMAPKLMNLLRFQVLKTDKTEYFMNLVLDGMKYREQHKIVRPDMIQLLMEAKKESKQNWTDAEIVAQCFLFFFAAFENNANHLALACDELMRNPDTQERLYEEALEVQAALNGATLDYDTLNKLEYMDMVLSETLRKWPLAQITDRVCAKDYTLTDEAGSYVFHFKKGDRILLPIIGLQRDAEYFENPDKFDPERFSDANKDKIQPFTYLPFGVGPRNCIGMRYALMQTKAMLYYLILNFKFERSAKTLEDLNEKTNGFQVAAKSGFWMQFVPRK